MIDKLFTYQEEDAKLKAIEKELNESVEWKKSSSARKYLKSVDENISKLDDKASNLINDYEKMVAEQKSINDFIGELKSAIENMKDENEGAYLLKKIETAGAKLKAVLDEIKRISNEINAVRQEFSSIKNDTERAKAQYEEYNEKFKALLESKKPLKEEIEKNLAVLEKQIEPNLLEKYKQKRDNKIFPVIKYANGNFCGYCSTEFPLGDINKLKGGEMIECTNCGRINLLKK